MTIDSITGLIQWAPTASGDYPVTVQVSNAVNPDDVQSFTIHVIDPGAIPAGLISYWKLDETVMRKLILTRWESIMEPAMYHQPQLLDKLAALNYLTAATTKIDVPANPSLDFAAADNFSVEFWYKGSTVPSANKVAVSRDLLPARFWWVGINAAIR